MTTTQYCWQDYQPSSHPSNFSDGRYLVALLHAPDSGVVAGIYSRYDWDADQYRIHFSKSLDVVDVFGSLPEVKARALAIYRLTQGDGNEHRTAQTV